MHCGNIKFAEVPRPGVVEVKCRSQRCGAGKGIVVIHVFDVDSQKLLETKRYREPPKGVPDAT